MLVLLSAVAPAGAQEVVRGTVRDADTGEPLPAASIQIEGTYRGTITNDEGVYALRVPKGPVTLIARYIGYETRRQTLPDPPRGRQDFLMAPTTYELDELVVTDEDPAVNIMRRVIAAKQRWQAALATYEAEAYNRFTLSNDTGIVSVIETLTAAFWDREQGMREVLKARQETSNLDFAEDLPAAFFVENLYDDDVEIAGYRLIGVTHPEALRHYRFRLEGTRSLDDQVVYDIAVEPNHARKSAFVGRVSVLGGAYALVDVALRPSAAFRFPPPIRRYEATYRQQFSNFGEEFWLPVDFRAEAELELDFFGLLRFPTIRLRQASRFTNYAVNEPLPDSLFEDDDYLRIDTAAVASGGGLEQAGARVPLTTQEQQAYATIDSTMLLAEAYRPVGPLARFVDLSEEPDEPGRDGRRRTRPFEADVVPELWYNRVDAVHVGLRPQLEYGRVGLRGNVGFSTGPDGADRWSYGGAAEVAWGPQRRGFVRGGYEAGTALRYESELYGRFANSLYVLLGNEDYFDYFRNERFFGSLGYRVLARPAATLALTYRDAAHASLERNTNYDLLGEAEPLPENPAVPEGRLRSVTASLALGDEPEGFLGLFGRRGATLAVEHSPDDVLASDFSFTRYTFLADWRFDTFFRRRFIPNTLDLRLSAATYDGDLPPQRFGTVDASLGLYSPFGALKTLDRAPYEGDQHVAVFWEHNFRTIPFELVGFGWAVEQAYTLIVFGGHGRTWVDAAGLPEGFVPRVSDGFHHEVGLSLSGLLGFVRVDVAARLDAPGVAVGVAAARIF